MMMNKLTSSLSLFFVLIGLSVSAQTLTIPVVPEQVTFADIVVRLNPDARRIVQQDVNALLANRQYWTAKLDRVVLYFPMIESILIDEDVPTDFKYLAVQESSLTPDAVSSSTAVGYWQFKRETAVDNGMRVDDVIDERKSITGSTHGAANYLKRSNGQFNNWVASLYSYYLGAGGIAKLIPPDWSYAREVALDGNTDRYILRFFAHKVAIESALKFHQTTNRFALIEYPDGGGKTMKSIAEELGIDEFELRKYNRWVLGDGVPTDKMYVMAVPVSSDQINDVRQKIVSGGSKKTPDFVQNDVGFPVLRRVTTGIGSKNDPILYEINGLPGIQAQAGDDAGSLARKSKISLSSFLRYNDMTDRDPILVNDVYYLAKKRKKALVPFHTVREDETSRSISQRYGIRLKKLMRYNRLDRVQKLATGRVMWLRERRPSNKPVEIINAPMPPIYDRTPTPPTRQNVASIGTSRPATGSDAIPRNASERKLYQPKLVGGGITPNDGTSEPATPQRAEPQSPSIQPSTSRTTPARKLVPTVTTPLDDSNGSQRVVIVRTPNGPEPTKAVPVATTPEREQPVGSSVAAMPKLKVSDTYASTPKTKPTPTTDLDMGRPSVGRPSVGRPSVSRPSVGRPSVSRPEIWKYEGPREQQADGSLTIPTAVSTSKAPPRPAPPSVTKTETRPAPPVVTSPEPKEVSTSTTTRSTTPATMNRSATTHSVEPGQTYYSISKLYGLTVEELLVLNNLTTDDKLEVGQKLAVKFTPGGQVVKPSTATKTTLTPQSAVTYHTVAKGETMFRISQIYGVSIEQIQSWNNLTDAGVKVGQKIKIMKL